MSADLTPLVAIEVLRLRPQDGRWLVSWRLSNRGGEPLALLDAHCPHQGFRSALTGLASRIVAPGEEAVFELTTAYGEPAGSVIDNAFLIVRFRHARKEWRLFAKLTVACAPEGQPQVSITVVTVYPVGFAERLSR
ncbi:MAG TPA: hypothetical protein VNL15_08980 [Dehalococcoidia bacterium]|nr:hypothetical protein [Dehalococcoidia bacterium]